MATRQTQVLGRALHAPPVILLFIWMIVPLAMTIYFSLLHYSLLNPGTESFVGLENYAYFLTDPAFLASLWNTLVLIGSVLVISIGFVLALSLARPERDRPQYRAPHGDRSLLRHADGERPRLEEPSMHPVSGLFAWIATSLGMTPIDWFTDAPLFAVILIVSWQWLPFATLILLTALQSLDEEQKEAAEMDGARAVSTFIYITLPHLARPITVVILIETPVKSGVCIQLPGHVLGEVGEHLVGRGAPAIDEAIRQLGGPLAHGMEEHRDHDRRRHRERRAADVASQRPDADHDTDVDGGQGRGEQAVAEGLADDDVDLVEAVLEDRDRDSHGESGQPDDGDDHVCHVGHGSPGLPANVHRHQHDN